MSSQLFIIQKGIRTYLYLDNRWNMKLYLDIKNITESLPNLFGLLPLWLRNHNTGHILFSSQGKQTLLPHFSNLNHLTILIFTWIKYKKGFDRAPEDCFITTVWSSSFCIRIAKINSDMYHKLGTIHPSDLYPFYLEASWLHEKGPLISMSFV